MTRKTQEFQCCGYFRALKLTAVTKLALPPARQSSQPPIAALPAATTAHHDHTRHTRTTKGHSWTTDLDCCFTLELSLKTSFTSGLKQQCVNEQWH